MLKKSQKFLNFINRSIKKDYKEANTALPNNYPYTLETVPSFFWNLWYPRYCEEVLKHPPKPYVSKSTFILPEKKPRRIINA